MNILISNRISRIARRLGCIGLIVASVGCGSDAITSTATGSPVGHWTAASIGGQSLPVALAFELDGTTAILKSWTMDFASDGTMRQTAIAEARQGNTVIETDTIPGSGVWFQTGSTVSLSFSDGLAAGDESAATIGGNRLTFGGNGFNGAIVFQR